MKRFVLVLMGFLMAINFSKADSDDEDTANKTSEGEQPTGLGHVFFRTMRTVSDELGSRRVFGGTVTDIKDFPAICALMDNDLAMRCSGSIITPHWVLTAGHCVNPRVAFVKYNTRQPRSSNGTITAIDLLYVHPSYNVVQVTRTEGTDVAGLHHDIGLVSTKKEMVLPKQMYMLSKLNQYNSLDLINKEVQVMGYGRTENTSMGEELFGAQLELVKCGNHDWVHCVCGQAVGIDARGVCSGDSGGPLVYKGHLVGVTSMGPVECGSARSMPLGLTSVFTSLYQYADIINNTVHKFNINTMRKISLASPPCVTSKFIVLANLILLSNLYIYKL